MLAYKCYDDERNLVASTKDATLAAAIMAALPEGSCVKHRGRIVWREGSEVVPAADSYDSTADIIDGRIIQRAREEAARRR